MENKKILFVMTSLRIGGIESALANMLNKIDAINNEVTLLLFHYEESYKKQLDSNIKIITGSKLLDILAMTKEEAKLKGGIFFGIRVILALMCRVLGANFVYDMCFLLEKNIGEYDYAVSYTNNITPRGTYFGANKYVLKKVKAKKKIAWIHVDYEKMGLNNRVNNTEYNKFDAIVHVSQVGKEKFIKYNPEQSDKSFVIKNMLNIEKLHSMADGELERGFDETRFNIVTIGRLDSNKNQIQCIEIAKKLRLEGLEFEWWLVGDGPNRIVIEECIKENKLDEVVHTVGYLKNPMPMLRYSKLLVSLSLSEGFPLVLMEALELNIPIVVNEFPAVREIVTDSNGIITSNYEDMYVAIKELIVNKSYYNRLKNGVKPIDENEKSIKLFYEMLKLI